MPGRTIRDLFYLSMTKTAKREFGDWGEEQSCLFLVRQGYEIIERNFVTRRGEVDIIAWGSDPRLGRVLCFIEVKTRTRDDGFAEYATNWEKIQRIHRAAEYYCYVRKVKLDETFIRFEHISVYANRDENSVSFKKYVLPAY